MDWSWPDITAASGGWALTSGFVWALITGRLVTRREAEVYLKQGERAQTNVETLIGTVAEMTAVGKVQRKFSEIGMERAETPESGDG